jgi:hypothetical protein
MPQVLSKPKGGVLLNDPLRNASVAGSPQNLKDGHSVQADCGSRLLGPLQKS